MLTKIIDENSVSCVPEDSDDLIILRRVIKKGDKIIGETVRVVKQEKILRDLIKENVLRLGYHWKLKRYRLIMY